MTDLKPIKLRERGQKLNLPEFKIKEFEALTEEELTLRELEPGTFIQIDDNWKLVDNVHKVLEQITNLGTSIIVEAYIVTTKIITKEGLTDERETYCPSPGQVFKVKRFLIPPRKKL